MDQSRQYVICEISDQTFNPEFVSSDISDYRIRKAARGILLHNGRLALLHVSNRGYYKFPGGGIETGETNEEAFVREAIEEAGCRCKIISQDGITIEYKSQDKILQISYTFLAEVIGEPGVQNLEEGEITDGHDLGWYTIEEAEKLLAEGKPDGYMHRFIGFRDNEIFKFYKNRLLEIPSQEK